MGCACSRTHHGGKCTHSRAAEVERKGGGRGGHGEGQEEGLLRHWQLGALTGACARASYARGALVLVPKWVQNVWVARWGPPTSTKGRGKVPAMEPLPPEMDEKLVQWLQQEEVAMEEVRLGWDTATLEVVMEAAGPLI